MNQLSTSSLSSQQKFSQMIKRALSWIIPKFYKHYWSYKVPNPSLIGVASHAMPCGFSLHLPSSPKFEQEPIGLLQLPILTSNMLYSGLTCQYVMISSLIYDLGHNFHRISIIGVIAVINVRGSSQVSMKLPFGSSSPM